MIPISIEESVIDGKMDLLSTEDRRKIYADSMVTKFPICIAKRIQDIGAVGYMHAMKAGVLYTYGYSQRNGCVDYDSYSIEGTKINIFGAENDSSSITKLAKDMRVSNNILIANISDTPNPFNNYLFPHSYSMIFFSWIYLAFTLYCSVESIILLRNVNTNTISITLLNISNILRMAVFIDPLGVSCSFF